MRKSAFYNFLRFIKNFILQRKEYLPGFKKQFLTFGKNSTIYYPSNIPDKKFIKIGNNTTILQNSRMQVFNYLTGLKANIAVGDNCYICSNLTLLAGANINIGNDVIIASNVLVASENHGIDPESNTPYMNQPLACKEVFIEDGCWIGEKASILSGVHIGKKCIVATNAVVTKNIPDYSMVAGIPAKIIKKYNFQTHKWEKENV